MASKHIYFGDRNGVGRDTEKILFGNRNGVGRTVEKVLYGDENGTARIVFNTIRQVITLWDSDLGIKHSMANDFASAKADTDAYLWAFEGYNLIGSGQRTPPGAGNSSVIFNKGIKRRNAKKLYIEVECSKSYTPQYAGSAMILTRNKTQSGYKPSGYLTVDFVKGNSSGPIDNYTHKQPYNILDKILIAVDITSIEPDEVFYLAFWKCNEYTKVSKCFFDGNIEIVEN